jgi:hypothetical protein
MQQYRSQINLFIISIIVSILLFFLIPLNIWLYSGIFLLIWFALILNFKLYKNIELFCSSLIISYGNLIVLMAYLISQQQLTYTNKFLLFFDFLLLFFIFSILYFRFEKVNINDQTLNKEELYPQRKEDLKRLIYYLEKFNIIGINAPWGEGKSFLFDKLKEKHENKYEIIEVDILACNFDELRITLIKELENLMYKNKVISKYSSRLKKLMSSSSNNLIQFLKALLFSDVDSFASTIHGLKKDLKKLDKNIIINFEDIDRINNRETIIKIFSLSEKLAADNIKIIFQVNEKVLIEEKEFKAIYLEKYLQHKINLTKINFFDIIDNLYESGNYNKELVFKEDFKFLRTRMKNISFIDFFDDFSLNGELSIEFNNLNIRKMKIFLNEIFAAVEDETLEVDKRTIIAFFFLKHFYSNKFRELNFKDNLNNTFTFKVNNEDFTLGELIVKRQMEEITQDNFEKIFQKENNRVNLIIFKLFDYDFGHINVKVNEMISNMDASQKEIKNFDFEHKNLKKNRMINKLYANGRSQFTNYEKAVEIFIDEVLSKRDNKEQEKGKKMFNNILFQNNLIDNRSIFKLGTNDQAELFKAFNVAENVTENEKVKLINFYFSQKPDNIISEYLISTLNYVQLRSRKEYLAILKHFNDLKIEGNLNRFDSFSTFFRKYLSAISELGFLETSDYFMLHTNKSLTKQFNMEKPVKRELNKIKNNLINMKNNLKNSQDFDVVVNDYKTIINFVIKLEALISCNEIYKEKYYDDRKKPEYLEQNEFYRLKKIDSRDKRAEESKNSYKKGKITAMELNKLM